MVETLRDGQEVNLLKDLKEVCRSLTVSSLRCWPGRFTGPLYLG